MSVDVFTGASGAVYTLARNASKDGWEVSTGGRVVGRCADRQPDRGFIVIVRHDVPREDRREVTALLDSVASS